MSLKKTRIQGFWTAGNGTFDGAWNRLELSKGVQKFGMRADTLLTLYTVCPLYGD